MDGDELRAIEGPLKDRYREAPTDALVTLSAQGTLAVAKDAPVGFTAIRVAFDLDTDASEEELDTPIRLTERYCVVFQTLARSPALSVVREGHHSEPAR